MQSLDEWVSMNHDPENIQLQKREFKKMAGFPNVVGVLDCTQIRIQAPTENESAYVNRKNQHSINVQLMCESNYRISNAVIQYPGSVHDSRFLFIQISYR